MAFRLLVLYHLITGFKKINIAELTLKFASKISSKYDKLLSLIDRIKLVKHNGR